MDLATRKRYHSTCLDAPQPKIPASSIGETPTEFANLMTGTLLNALKSMETSQRTTLLDDLISRLQWLKQQYQQSETSAKKPCTPEKSTIDPQQMQLNILKQQEMLQNMSKVISLTTLPETRRTPPVQQVLAKKWDSPMAQKTTLQAAEEFMLDLQDKQNKLLKYISSAHGGNVTNDVLHEYLKHPYVLLKENGVVTPQVNPFYHLMSQNTVQPMKMMAQKPTTPIPAPPILTAEVRKEMTGDLKNASPADKVSPPPQLPRQVTVDPTKPFEAPTTRQCNQWSVFSMALPLRLLCKCHKTPCRCL